MSDIGDAKSLGQVAYETYRKAAGGKSAVTGATLYAWDQ